MPTYTNLCILQGWLEVVRVRCVEADRISALVIDGYIETTDHDGIEQVFEDRHPIIISGRTADVVIEILRKMNERPITESGICLFEISGSLVQEPGILVNQAKPFVIAQGKLVNHAGQSCINIKHISFLGFPWGALEMLDKKTAPMRITP